MSELIYNFKIKIKPCRTNRKATEDGFNGFGKVRSNQYVYYGTYSKWQEVAGIYWIKNKVTNYIYIGSTKNIGRRISKHFSQLRTKKHPNSLMRADFDKYGQESFEFGVYEITNENLLEKEANYQKQFSLNELYNLQIKNIYRSPAQRLACKTSDKSSHKTKEYRDKMRKIKSNKIGQFDKDTNKLIKVYENSDEVCKNFDIAKSTLLGCCNGSKKTGLGYIWHYLDENNNIIKQGKGKIRDIIQNEDIV